MSRFSVLIAIAYYAKSTIQDAYQLANAATFIVFPSQASLGRRPEE